MMISLTIKRLLIALVVVTLGFVSCSDKEAKVEPMPQDTLAMPDTVTAASDSAPVRSETIRMVVGGTIPSGPEELLPIDPAIYSDWKVVRVENLKLLCPQDHAHGATLEGLGRAMVRALDNDSRFLGIEVPKNEIVIIYYTGPGHGKETTGMNYSFATGDTLHYWPPNSLGVPVMKYLIPKWQNVETRHDFLRQGLIKLLDGSGKDYHKWTLTAYQQNRLTPLSQLAADTTVSADEGGQPVAFAASFVDFIMYAYGRDALVYLYRSQDDFDTTVKGLFMITTDSLQAQWVDVLGKVEEIKKQAEQ